MTDELNRRAFLSTSARAGGAVGLGSAVVRAQSSALADVGDAVPGGDSRAQMPCATIGKVTFSRLIIGSNLMSACSHDRDLIYVSSLMRAYNTEQKLMETLKAAESAGINTVLQGDAKLIQKYNAEHSGHLQQIRPLKVAPTEGEKTIRERIATLLAEKAAALYVYGGSADKLARDGQVEMIGKALQWGKAAGAVIGVGGHSLKVVIECERHGFEPDFYLKTFHHDRYWSATPKEHRADFCWYQGVSQDHNAFHDNIWCLDPEKTIEVMRAVKAPWIAYKVLAAGAIHPRQGFDYAFRNGADFIAVGMFDFQVREDAELTARLVSRLAKRDRPWRG